jgi:hypothetical protein
MMWHLSSGYEEDGYISYNSQLYLVEIGCNRPPKLGYDILALHLVLF